MKLCPKTANAFNAKPLSDDQAATWCRDVYRSGDDRCEGCELRHRLGVGLEDKGKAMGKDTGKHLGKATQERLF